MLSMGVAVGWRPAADIYETATAILVTVELPGVQLDEAEVRLLEGALIVTGRRRLPDLDDRGIYHTVEIRRGPFRAEITLPARVEAQPRELRAEHGFLYVRFNKKVDADGQ
jgi:HSP20 family protein